jgi:hypothetical protein
VVGVAGAERSRRAQAVAGVDYGGGALLGKFAKHDFPDGNVVGLRTGADVGTARAFTYVKLPCRAGRRFESHGTTVVYTSLTIHPDATGRFSARKRQRGRNNLSVARLRKGESFRTTTTLSGQITGSRASGEVRVINRYRLRGRGRVTCRSGAQHWESRTGAEVGDAPASPTAGATYRGPATQPKGPNSVNLRVSPDGTRIDVATITLFVTCYGTAFPDPNSMPPMPIKPDGSFAGSYAFSNRFGESFVVSISGRFVAGGVRGTIGDDYTLRYKGRTYRCPDTNVPFVATQ